MKKSLLSIVFLLFSLAFYAANTEIIKVFSRAMQKDISVTVVTPDNYSQSNTYPVVYLLHGYGGDHTHWAGDGFDVVKYADVYDLIFIMPDGANSWYFDSPVDDSYKYETFIIDELVPFVDSKYATRANKSGRAITGFSMGGHGALYLAFRHQDVFGAAGSTSGGVDIRPFPNKWELSQRLGSYSEYPQHWEDNTVINMIGLLSPDSLSIIFDCGTEDFFYDVNVNFHKKLLENNIPHDFISRPGAHTGEYWKNSIQYQLLYFNNYFKQNN